MKVYVPSVEKIKSFEWDYKNTYLSDVFDTINMAREFSKAF